MMPASSAWINLQLSIPIYFLFKHAGIWQYPICLPLHALKYPMSFGLLYTTLLDMESCVFTCEEFPKEIQT
jgi:hypothetical protein